MKEETNDIESKRSFIFYSSFKDALDDLEDMDKLSLYKAITEYGLNRKIIEMTKMSNILFKLIKPQLDANWRKYENAKHGGAPIGNKNAKRKI
jgi:hypothetical protein